MFLVKLDFRGVRSPKITFLRVLKMEGNSCNRCQIFMRCSCFSFRSEDMTHGKCHAKNDMTEGNRKIGTLNSKLTAEEKQEDVELCHKKELKTLL